METTNLNTVIENATNFVMSVYKIKPSKREVKSNMKAAFKLMFKKASQEVSSPEEIWNDTADELSYSFWAPEYVTDYLYCHATKEDKEAILAEITAIVAKTQQKDNFEILNNIIKKIADYLVESYEIYIDNSEDEAPVDFEDYCDACFEDISECLYTFADKPMTADEINIILKEYGEDRFYNELDIALKNIATQYK